MPSSLSRLTTRRTTSFDELRTGFTAAVSHELRTPLARIMALLDSADLPGADVTRCSTRRGPRSSTPAS